MTNDQLIAKFEANILKNTLYDPAQAFKRGNDGRYTYIEDRWLGYQAAHAEFMASLDLVLYMAKNLHNKSYATSRSEAEAKLFLSQSGLKVDGVESAVIPLYAFKASE